jgi:hypothetical protein
MVVLEKNRKAIGKGKMGSNKEGRGKGKRGRMKEDEDKSARLENLCLDVCVEEAPGFEPEDRHPKTPILYTPKVRRHVEALTLVLNLLHER